jgi:hypothetical protein
MGIAERLNIAVVLPMMVAGGITAAPAQADYYDYVDTLEANGLLVYEKPPRCTPRPQIDPLCPTIDKFYGDDDAYRYGRQICDTIQSGGTRADAIENLTMFQGMTYTESAASAIYDIAVTNLCWQ